MSSDEEPGFDERHGFWGEDGQWYERRDNQYTKDDHIYGVFAQNSFPSSNRSHHPYKHNKPQIDPQSSTLQFSFVKGGVQTVNDDIKKNTSSNDNNSTTTNNNDEHSILKEWEAVKQQKHELNASRHGPQLGSHGLPKQLGQSMKSNSNTTRSTNHGIGIKRDQGYAKWTESEKRTKFGGLSFAERYLKKHGFQGRLGKAEQGIANPVKQATSRKYNEGLGFNGRDEIQHQPKNVQQELNEIRKRTEMEKEKIKETEKLWKIIDQHENDGDFEDIQPRKRRKVTYQTVSDYMKQNGVEKMRIHDYTKEDVVVTTTDRINDGGMTEYNGICPAFRHNIDRICDLVEERKMVLHREGENLKQQKHTVGVQLDALRKGKVRKDERDRNLYELKELLRRLEVKTIDLTDGDGDDGVSSDEMYNVFEEIQTRFYGEYTRYKLWRLYGTVLFPRLKEELDAMEDVGGMVSMLNKWRGLLSGNGMDGRRKDVYDLLIDDVIVPKLRKALYEWHPLEMDVNAQFVGLFKGFKDVIPANLYRKLLNNLIIPRLNYVLEQSDGINDEEMMRCVIAWDFVFECDGIDDILGRNISKKMKRFWRGFNGRDQHELYIKTLKNWEMILVNIMDTKSMTSNVYEVIVDGIIMKKLGKTLADCVNKLDGDTKGCVEQMHLVHLWYLNDVLNIDKYLKLLKESFFDKWLLFIYHRLKDLERSMMDNKEEAVHDVEFIWNNLFAVIKNELFKTKYEKINYLIINEMIERYLDCFLDMMNWIISDDENQELPSFDIIRESVKMKKDKKRDRKRSKKGNDNEVIKNDIIFKNTSQSIGIIEFVEMKAQNHGVEFCLDFNKKHDGKKVYKFGKLFICFYDKSIFAKQGDEWKPIDIQDLLRMA